MSYTQNVQSTMMCVRRCAQHWRKWARIRSMQRPKQPADQQQLWNMHSSHRAVSDINTDWIDLVKYDVIVFDYTMCISVHFIPITCQLLSHHVSGILKLF